MTEKMDGNRVVISGISGTFPQCNNVKEFSDILYNRVNPVTPLTTLSFKHPEMPVYSGKAPNLRTFDAQFFKVNYHLGRFADVMSRKLLEHTYQAIFDAGVSLEYLNNRKVGVFLGSSMTEAEKCVFYNDNCRNGLSLVGTGRTMFVNRISYWLNTTGPSFNTDVSACSSMAALEQAWHAIVNGRCDAAIVTGCYISLQPQTFIINRRMMNLTMSDCTKSFDQNADGCVMSDAVSVLLLQKAKDALRVYAEVEHVKCIFSPIFDDTNQCPKTATANISKFLGNFYKEADISPDLVEFVEAFGIADPAFDKAELEAIDEVFCKSRKECLTVGSVMSNIGNTESASSLTALTKVILAYHEGKIAANLHYNDPHSDVSAIHQGRLRIASDHDPFDRTYAAVNNFCFSGIMGHALLKGSFKPKDIERYKSIIPRLVLISGRTESSVEEIIEYLKSRPVDPEEIALLHKFHQYNIPGHLGRGYVIIDSTDNETYCITESMRYCDRKELPLWFVYSGMGSQWPGMGAQLMAIPTFAAAIERCRAVLEPMGVDIIQIITSPDKTIFDKMLHSFLGITAVQIGLTDVLRELGIEPDGIIGHSVGELGCGYADGCLTAEELILSAYCRGLVSVQTPFIRGAMAAVGIGYQKMIKLLPPEIEVACHNGPDSCTISGPSDAVAKMIQELTAKSIYAKEVQCSNIAYHSRYIAHAGPKLLELMKKVITSPKPRSSRWVSTSVPQSKWDEPIAKYSSAEYYTNNLVSPVLFEETMRLIPSNAVLIEIAPHGLLQAILRRSLPGCYNLALTNRESSDNLSSLLEGIGKLYEIGKNPDVSVLYPKVEFPVSTETPMLSHLVTWSHTEVWPLPVFKTVEKVKSATCDFIISTYDEEYKFLEGHVYKGRNLYPFSAALVSVWDTLAMVLNVRRKQLTVEFRDVHFYSQPIMLKDYPLHVKTFIQRGTGRFEVYNEESRIAIGYIIYDDTFVFKNAQNDIAMDENEKIDSSVLYQLLYEKDFLYKNDFKSIVSVSKTLDTAELVWNNNWVTFIDGLVQLNMLRQKLGHVEPRLCFMKKMTIDINRHENSVGRFGSTLPAYIVDGDVCTSCGGISIEKMTFFNNPVVSKNLDTALKATYKETDKKNYSSNTDVMLLSGSLSNFNSLRWEQVAKLQGSDIDVKVYYAGINQYDVKFAEGSIPAVAKRTFDAGYGMDVAGLTANGTRVMGLVEGGAVRSHVRVRPELLWPVPAHWSLEDAATVPLAYSLAFYCLVVKYRLYRGLSIFVHGGAGALGQAVISIALAHDCEVFTTVSNVTKKKFLKRLYPKLKVENIGNSRDDSFVNMVLSATQGKGCNYFINCGNGATKTVSLKCCSSLGIVMDTSLIQNCEDFQLGLSFLDCDRSFITVNLLSMFENQNITEMKKLQGAMCKGIARGYVRPLTRVTFAPHEAPRAFAFLSASRHRGRVLLRLEQADHIESKKTRIDCNPNLWSILIFEDMVFGSLLAEKLVERGARKLHLYCPQPLDYLNYKIQLLQEKGVKVEVEDIIKYNYNKQRDLPNILDDVEVEGLYIVHNKQNVNRHISVIIQEFEVTPKNIGRSLTYFAVININSELDNLSTDVTQNLSATTIINVPKINTISDDYNTFISLYGTVDAIEKAIVSRDAVVEICMNYNVQHSLLQEVANIAGIVIPDDVEDAAVADICTLDSHKSVAISLHLQDYNIFVPVEDIPLLKIKRLREIDQILNKRKKRVPGDLESFFSFRQLDELEAYVEIILLPTLTQSVFVNDSEIDLDQDYLFVIPGIEGHYSRFREICERVKVAAIVLQPIFEQSFATESEQAQRYAELLIHKLKITDNFYLLGYEYGIPLALEVAAILESHGLQGTVFCIGHTVDGLRAEVALVLSAFKDETEIREAVIHEIIHQLKGTEITLPSFTQLGWKKELESYLSSPVCRLPHNSQYLLELVEGTYNRLLRARDVVVRQRLLRSQLVFVKARSTKLSDSSMSSLKCYSQKPVAVYDLETPLALIAKDPRCATIVNEHLSPDIQKAYNEKNICNTYLSMPLKVDMD